MLCAVSGRYFTLGGVTLGVLYVCGIVSGIRMSVRAETCSRLQQSTAVRCIYYVELSSWTRGEKYGVTQRTWPIPPKETARKTENLSFRHTSASFGVCWYVTYIQYRILYSAC